MSGRFIPSKTPLLLGCDKTTAIYHSRKTKIAGARGTRPPDSPELVSAERKTIFSFKPTIPTTLLNPIIGSTNIPQKQTNSFFSPCIQNLAQLTNPYFKILFIFPNTQPTHFLPILMRVISLNYIELFFCLLNISPLFLQFQPFHYSNNSIHSRQTKPPAHLCLSTIT